MSGGGWLTTDLATRTFELLRSGSGGGGVEAVFTVERFQFRFSHVCNSIVYVVFSL